MRGVGTLCYDRCARSRGGGCASTSTPQVILHEIGSEVYGRGLFLVDPVIIIESCYYFVIVLILINFKSKSSAKSTDPRHGAKSHPPGLFPVNSHIQIQDCLEGHKHSTHPPPPAHSLIIRVYSYPANS